MPAMRNIAMPALREVLLRLLFFLPQPRRIALERELRGREEFRKLRQADCVIVSFGKSGRTWLRVMLSRFYQSKYNLSGNDFLRFDNLHRKNPAIPRLFFTHDNYIKDYTNNRDSKADFYDRKVILLVRDPRDVAVSQFFQWKYRMKPGKKTLNGYPAHAEEVSIFEFVMRCECGLPKIIAFLNDWQRELERIERVLVVRYEDLRRHPESNVKRILDFIGTPATDEQAREAVAFASYDNMKRLENGRVAWLHSTRLVPGDRNNPDSYKVRRAKVGGYRDYFDERQVAAIDELIGATLTPAYGYGDAAERQPGAAVRIAADA